MNKKILFVLLNFLSFSTLKAIKIEEINDDSASVSSSPITQVNFPADKTELNPHVQQSQVTCDQINILEDLIPIFDGFFNPLIYQIITGVELNGAKNGALNIKSFDELMSCISIVFTDIKLSSLNPTFEKIFKEEYAPLCSSAILSDDLSLKLVVEGTYWILDSSLKAFIDAMTTYEEVANFRPLEEMFNGTPIGEAVQEVANKMVVPVMSHNASYALKQAAGLIYAKKVGKEVFDREQAEFDARRS